MTTLGYLKRTMGITFYIIAALVLVGVLIVFKLLLVYKCQFCNENCVTFKKLDTAQLKEVKNYFERYEKRDAKYDKMFFCTSCNIVHDDFSGEAKSWDSDHRGNTTFCKHCSHMIFECNPKNTSIRCPHCGETYEWKTFEDSTFVFLQPKNTKSLLEFPHYDHGRG